MHKLIFAVIFFLFSNLIYAQKPITIQNAIKAGIIQVKVSAKKSAGGQNMILLLEKLVKRDIELILPVGQLFTSDQADLQNQVQIQPELLTLSESKTEKAIFTLCTEGNDRTPTEGAPFSLGEMASGALLVVVQQIAKHTKSTSFDAQSAIWAVTNGYPVATIDHHELLKATCMALHISVPEYNIVQNQQSALVGERAMHFAPLRIEGKFSYQSEEPNTLNVYLIDSLGTKIRTLIPDKIYQAGSRVRFTFRFETQQLAFGKYQVSLYAGEIAVKTIKVDYLALTE
jgi:hypothetical protein